MAYAKMGAAMHTRPVRGEAVSFARNVAFATTSATLIDPWSSVPASNSRRAVSQRDMGLHAEEQLPPLLESAGIPGRGGYIAHKFSDRHPCDHPEHDCAEKIKKALASQEGGTVVVYYLIPYGQPNDDVLLKSRYTELGLI